jgi:hypothetical protein
MTKEVSRMSKPDEIPTLDHRRLIRLMMVAIIFGAIGMLFMVLDVAGKLPAEERTYFLVGICGLLVAVVSLAVSTIAVTSVISEKDK